MAICPRKYQHPRSGGCSGWSGCGGCGGYSGRGRPGCVAPKQQLQYTIYSSTAVQQYSSATETAVQQPFTPHTPSGGRRINVVEKEGIVTLAMMKRAAKLIQRIGKLSNKIKIRNQKSEFNKANITN